MFDDCGFAVYEDTQKVLVPKHSEDDEGSDSAAIRHRLDVREVLENIKNKYYELEERH